MNCYEILEVSPNASPAVIKAAFKSLMLRCHPDKNPGDAQMAEHASLVVQAYEVLSDPDRRAVYDLSLNQQTPAPTLDARYRNRETSAPSGFNEFTGDKHQKIYWVVWALIALTIMVSTLLLFYTPQRQVSEPTPSMQNTIGAQEASDVARTLPLFLVRLNINLQAIKKPSVDADISADGAGKTADAQEDIWSDSGYVLSIPVLGVKVGTFDSEKVIRYLEANEMHIRQKLEKKLAKAKYEELTKIDGEQYLKNMILDAIEESTGTNRREDYPSSPSESPGRYGVIEALLSESFSVRKASEAHDFTP